MASIFDAAVGDTGFVKPTKRKRLALLNTLSTSADGEKFGDLITYGLDDVNFLTLNKSNSAKWVLQNDDVTQKTMLQIIQGTLNSTYKSIELGFDGNEAYLGSTNTTLNLNGNITGSVTNALSADKINLQNDSSDGSYFIPFAKSSSGSQSLFTDLVDSLLYNPSNGVFTVPTLLINGSNTVFGQSFFNNQVSIDQDSTSSPADPSPALLVKSKTNLNNTKIECMRLITESTGAYGQNCGPQLSFGAIFSNSTYRTIASISAFGRTTDPDAGSLVFETRDSANNIAGGRRVILTDTGRFGIGFNNDNANPLARLHCNDGDSIFLFFNSGNNAVIRLGNFPNTIGAEFSYDRVLDTCALSKPLSINGTLSCSNINAGGAIQVTGGVLPSLDQTYDLGSTTRKWNNIYANSAFVSSLDAGTGSIRTTGTINCYAISPPVTGGSSFVVTTGSFIPNITQEGDIGNSTNRYANVFSVNANISDSLTTGAVTLNGHITPSAHNTYSLGSSSVRFSQGHFASTLNCGSLIAGTTGTGAITCGTVQTNATSLLLQYPTGSSISIGQSHLSLTASSIRPDVDGAVDLGQSSRRFGTLYIGTRITVGTANDANYQLDLSADTARKLTTTTWTTGSDERVKQDIEDANLDICYDNVKNLKLKRFKWNEEYYPDVKDRHMLGWIAQQVEPMLPHAVTTTTEKGFEDFKSLDSDQIIKQLYGCVQKLIYKVEQLELQNSELQNYVAMHST